jgi:Rrf2 family protein
MLTISRETDYACRVILHLSLLPADSRVTAQEIAKRRIIPRALIRRVITRLGKAKLIVTTRGSGGGLALARPPSEINLLQVLQAMDGPIALNPCVVNPQSCPLMATCSVHEALVNTQSHLIAELSQATFDKLAERGHRLIQKK